jgi:hypothetical protein
MQKLANAITGYAKMHTAFLGGVVSFLTVHYGGSWWLPIVTLAATALGVGAVPNSKKTDTASKS